VRLDWQQERTVIASSSAQAVLLVNEHAGTVLPYSTEAFQVSTGPTRRVLERYLNSLVVYRDGSVSRLEAIHFLGLWGANVWQRAFSFVNGGTRRISVSLRPHRVTSFEDTRTLIVDCVRRHPEVIEQYFEQSAAPEAVTALAGRAATCDELFDALGVPRPENSLDSLT
jgi:hypothetical protein